MKYPIWHVFWKLPSRSKATTHLGTYNEKEIDFLSLSKANSSGPFSQTPCLTQILSYYYIKAMTIQVSLCGFTLFYIFTGLFRNQLFNLAFVSENRTLKEKTKSNGPQQMVGCRHIDTLNHPHQTKTKTNARKWKPPKKTQCTRWMWDQDQEHIRDAHICTQLVMSRKSFWHA